MCACCFVVDVLGGLSLLVLDRTSLGSPRWLGVHNSLASAFPVQELEACSATPSFDQENQLSDRASVSEALLISTIEGTLPFCLTFVVLQDGSWDHYPWVL